MADMDHNKDKLCPPVSHQMVHLVASPHLSPSHQFTPHQSVLLGGGPLASVDLTLSNLGLRLKKPLMTIISQRGY